MGEYAGLLSRVCPAAVYEYVEATGKDDEDALGEKLVINSQNCIHCKTYTFFLLSGLFLGGWGHGADSRIASQVQHQGSDSSAFFPAPHLSLGPTNVSSGLQDITWTVPEGGGGPKYSVT